MKMRVNLIQALLVVGISLVATDLRGDTLTFRHLGTQETHTGNVLARYADGTLLFEGQDKQHYFIRPDDLVDWRNKQSPVKFWTREQMRSVLKKEFGAGFYVLFTNHYVVVYDCDRALAQQAATLLERAYGVFRAKFANQGAFQFENLGQPLVAVIFKDRQEYLEATKKELGSTLAWSAGLYAQNTNRFYMYDAFEGNLDRRTQVAMSPLRGASPRGTSVFDPRSIEVIVHEGTHQLAFNFGLHARHAFNPIWFVEGLATYFEASDPEAPDGWLRAGEINPGRLAHFARIMNQLPDGFLDRLVTDDKIFSGGESVADAYAQAWAFTYFLMKTKQSRYIRYIRAIQAHGLNPYGEKERLADFKNAFGTTPSGLEANFRRYMAGLVAAQAKSSAQR